MTDPWRIHEKSINYCVLKLRPPLHALKHYIQWTPGTGDPRTQDPGTRDPGTQIGMHCACTYGMVALSLGGYACSVCGSVSLIAWNRV